MVAALPGHDPTAAEPNQLNLFGTNKSDNVRLRKKSPRLKIRAAPGPPNLNVAWLVMLFFGLKTQGSGLPASAQIATLKHGEKGRVPFFAKAGTQSELVWLPESTAG